MVDHLSPPSTICRAYYVANEVAEFQRYFLVSFEILELNIPIRSFLSQTSSFK